MTKRTGPPILLLPLLCLAPAFAQQTTCTITAAPGAVVEGRDFQVTAGYEIAAGEAHLHAELKNTDHIVLKAQVVAVTGAGEQTLTLTAPAYAEAKTILVAVWLGEDWRQPLAPILHTEPIRVVTQAMADAQEKLRADAPRILEKLGWQRSPGGNIALLRDELAGSDPAVVDRYRAALEAQGAKVTSLTAEQLANPYLLAADRFDALLLVNARVVPASALDPAMDFLRSGGDLIAVGAPTFDRFVVQVGDQWLDRDQYLALLAQTKPTKLIYDFEAGDLPAYARGSSNTDSAATVEAATPGAAGTSRALQVKLGDFQGWDTLRLAAPEGAFPAGSTLTCFWARGGPRTTQLALEWQEKDGSRWIATVPLTETWRHYALEPGDFKYWRDNPSQGRGGTGDVLRPENAVGLSIGLAMTHTQLPGGEHEYWIDEIGSAPNPYPKPPSFDLPSPPILDTVSPRYKLFQVTSAKTLDTSAGRPLLGDLQWPLPASPWSTHPRPQGTGFAKHRKWRWVPLAQMRGPDGEVCGTLATLLIHGNPPLKGSLWASVTAHDEAYAAKAEVIEAVATLARRMLDGVFLYEGGAEFYAYFDGEPIRLGATVVNHGRQDGGSLAVEIDVKPKDRDGTLFARRFELTLPPGETRQVEATWERGVATPSEYMVSTRLLSGGKVIDELQHEVGIWRPREKRQYMTARDGDFYLGDRKWYPYGVNYMPSYECAIEDGEYFEFWLDSQPYDPVVIERDLARIERIGMNMVSVFVYTRSIPTRNLLDLLRRCENHHLWVNLSLRPGTPLDFVWPGIGDIIKSYRLAENDNVFAYDLAWEPAFWGYDSRKRWDGEWEKWVVERYGSIEVAERDWKTPIPRADGKVTSPSDAQVSSDGDWRVMVAAYRRFLDDLLSKAHLRAAQKVKSVDPNHLPSFRMTIAGDPTVHPTTMGYDFGALAKSMDIMCPEGYGRIGDWKQVVPGWFTAAYSRCAAPGKPVMWAEFGNTAWDVARSAPDPKRLDSIAQFYRDFLTMALKSGSNGVVCWYYPGGFRVGENSDFGIINPDGTWRGITEALHEFAPRFTQPRDIPQPNVWLDVDRDADARGLQGIWAAVGRPFLAAIDQGKVPGLRGGGEGATSADTPVIAVGNVPYNRSNPPKYLNAEFNHLQVRNAQGEWVDIETSGQEVTVARNEPVLWRASVGNSGWATWLSPATHPGDGAVYLATTTDSSVKVRQPVPADVPRLGDANLGEFRLPGAVTERTRLTFTMTAENRAWFGERLEIVLAPAP